MILESPRLRLRPFDLDQISETYLSWLNNSEVNQYSRRRFLKTTREDAEMFLKGLERSAMVFGMYTSDLNRHIGNIQWGPIDVFENRAEIRILVGEKSEWGKGYASEAIACVSRHLFEKLGIRRLEANTCNPAFARCMEKLGWTLEGRLRERFPYDGRYLDYLQFGLLCREMQEYGAPQIAPNSKS